VLATVGLLTWLLGPVVVAILAGVGLVAYGRGYLRGQRSSRCLLRDTRLVLAYLAVAFALAGTATVR
jgi:hypothetical protein